MHSQSVLLNGHKRLAKASCCASCSRLAGRLAAPLGLHDETYISEQQDGLLDGSQDAFDSFSTKRLAEMFNDFNNNINIARRLDAFLYLKEDTYMHTHAPTCGKEPLFAEASCRVAGDIVSRSGIRYKRSAKFPLGYFVYRDRQYCLHCGCLRCNGSGL